MLNNILKHKFKIVATIVVVLCFAAIRGFENQIFYDPFLVYFESDFKNMPFPEIDTFKLLGSLLVRFLLNTILSLILIYSLFQDIDMTRFSALLYGFFMVLLFVLFLVILKCLPEMNWLLFYVRRFLIQPIFVILFIPAFYYQQQKIKK